MGWKFSREDMEHLISLGATFGAPAFGSDAGPAPARKPSRVKGQMSPVESRYKAVLDARKAAGEIVGYEFEPDLLWLNHAARCSYLPDWKVWLDGERFEYHETKGRRGAESSGKMGDGIVKLKWAASKFAPIPFYLCVWKHGAWHIRPIPG
jgi:hypothetical protein